MYLTLKIKAIIYAVGTIATTILIVSTTINQPGPTDEPQITSTSKSCGASCPCNNLQLNESVEKHNAPVNKVSANNKHKPCQDKCPNDCPKCNCSRMMATEVLSLAATLSVKSYTIIPMITLSEEPPSGVNKAVYRPPRSLI